MGRRRVLAIGLDGLDVSLAESLMAAGEMPALADVRHRAARFLLDHGSSTRTGLAWEHVASGLSPDAAQRWAAVEFDPATYGVWQEGARFTPWWADLDSQVVVFDAPYVDLRRSPGTKGIVGWGAHDPGTVTAARPRALLKEFLQRFDPYPSEWTYETPWPSASRTRQMAAALSHALEVRAHAAQWLALDRLPEWDFFLAVAGELHGAMEGLWHGVDRNHPLHEHPSGVEAARGLIDVHRGLDRMVGKLVRTVGDAAVVAFTLGGMGPNHSDPQSMVLLPELLYRHAFGRSLLSVPSEWTAAPAQLPALTPHDGWGAAAMTWMPTPAQDEEAPGKLRAWARKLPVPLKAVLKAGRAAVTAWRASGVGPVRSSLDWQPAARYRGHWPHMPAFALPSFYDGRIRINLRGRERNGVVDPSRYDETCAAIEALLRESRNPLTGEAAVDRIERPATEPLALNGSDCDLVVVWRGVATALEHPRLGLIGPVPLRRTGGHTGPHGVAYVVAPDVSPGDRGVRSSFDVVPTIIELLGKPGLARLTGKSLLNNP